jgi:4-hydroxybenzoate polyprenyltransferase
MNAYTIALSFVAAFLAASYPFMKRYTQLPQAYLGIAFGFAVPMAFTAQLDTIPPLAWVLYLAVILWALIYDTMYAMVDIDDDLKIGVKSTAILFGKRVREITAVLQLIMLGLLVSVGLSLQLSWSYYLGLSLAAGLCVYQQFLIYHFDKTSCFKAFLNNNWFGLVVFAGLVCAYW